MNGHGLNIFKPRTRLGRWLDNNGYSQQEMIELTKINKTTMSSLCNDKNYDPHDGTKIKIIGTLKRKGYDVRIDDFWS